jgi:hypothetical protein
MLFLWSSKFISNILPSLTFLGRINKSLPPTSYNTFPWSITLSFVCNYSFPLSLSFKTQVNEWRKLDLWEGVKTRNLHLYFVFLIFDWNSSRAFRVR